MRSTFYASVALIIPLEKFSNAFVLKFSIQFSFGLFVESCIYVIDVTRLGLFVVG